jgi:Uncharacterized conserved small protein
VRIRYFADTDTLLIEFIDRPVADTEELDENTLLDLDENGLVNAITFEHASQRTGVSQFAVEQNAA